MAVLVDFCCDTCGATVERFVSVPITDAVECEECGGRARRHFGFGAVLGVRPARRARELLDRERAERVPLTPAARGQLHAHLHHDHAAGPDHAHHEHHHGHDGHEHHDHVHDAPT